VLFDDAMISMRYADNLAHGQGLVWNIGEHVEGFTNPLMVFVMTFGIAIFGENYAALFIQLLGVLCLVANIYLAVAILKKLIVHEDTKEFLIFIGTLLTMAWYPIMYWSVFGMETGFLTTLVLFAVYCLIKNGDQKIDILLALILSLIYLARPEGLLFVALVYLWKGMQIITLRKGIFIFILEAIVTAIPAVAYQLFRVHYYGSSVPNTYLLKAVGMPLLDKVKNGLGFYEPFLSRVELFLIVIALFFFVYLFEAHVTLKEKIKELLVGKFRFVTLFSLSFFVYSAYQIWTGGDPWPPFWRMTVPYTVLMFFAFLLVSERLKQVFTLRTDIFMAFVAFIVFSLLAFVPFDYHYDFTRLEPYQTRNNLENLNTALAINELTTSDATVASFWAGTIPYLTHRYSLDPLGKMDPHIAQLPPDLSGALSNPRGMYSIPGHNKYDLNYTFKEKNPDVIVYLAFNGHVCSWGQQNLEDWCKANYRLIDYKGVKLLLRNSSQKILWGKLTNHS
jgi:hypothetical protein